VSEGWCHAEALLGEGGLARQGTTY